MRRFFFDDFDSSAFRIEHSVLIPQILVLSGPACFDQINQARKVIKIIKTSPTTLWAKSKNGEAIMPTKNRLTMRIKFVLNIRGIPMINPLNFLIFLQE